MMGGARRQLLRCALLSALGALLRGSALCFSPAAARRTRATATVRAATTLLERPQIALSNCVEEEHVQETIDALRTEVARYEADLERLQAELELYALGGQLKLLEAEAEQLRQQGATQKASVPAPQTQDPKVHFARTKRDLILPTVIALSAALIGWVDGREEVQRPVLNELDPASPSPLMRKYGADSEQILRHMRVSVTLEKEAANRVQWNKHLMDEIAAWVTLYASEQAVADKQSFAQFKSLVEDMASSDFKEPFPRQQRTELLERIASCRKLVAREL